MTVILMGSTVNAQKFTKMDKSPMDRSYYPASAPHRFLKKVKLKNKH